MTSVVKTENSLDITTSTSTTSPYVQPSISSFATGSDVTYRVVWNDGKNNDYLMALIGAKNVFATQLPKMPKEYIVRLVLDRNHRTMVIQQGEKIIGGICYRPFFSQRFAEIVFCAVMSVEQGKGYGRHIMNHLKEHVKTEGIDFFLTYADNYAIKYFKKQGFSKALSMNPDRWKGWIKDYDGATLMECSIIREINYLHMNTLLKFQYEALYERIRKFSNTHCERPGVTHGFPIHPSQIPGLIESGWVETKTERRSLNADQLLMTAKLGAVLKALFAFKETWAFRKPVDKDVVVDYYNVIKYPMDLSTMESKLNTLAYTSIAAFEHDVSLIVTNCKTYNRANTTYVRHAEDTWKEYQRLIAKYFPDATQDISSVDFKATVEL